MNINILNYLKKYSYNVSEINRLLVSTFLIVNKIDDVENVFINSFKIRNEDTEEFKRYQEFKELFSNGFDTEMLLELFEFVISPVDKEINGAIYTPKYIRDFIVEKALQDYSRNTYSLEDIKIADISCGCGGFFVNVIDYLRIRCNKTFSEIFKNNIYGIDIQQYSVDRTKIILSLYAILNGEDLPEFNFNLFKGDSLEFDWNTVSEIKLNGGFNVILGNPPYVGASKIDDASKELVKRWSVSGVGKSDMYIPFFQIALENLTAFGILGYITVNTFQKSLNARILRQYFSANKFDFTLIDFGSEQIFKNRSTYTCICIISKTETSEIKYIKSDSKSLEDIKKEDFLTVNYNQLDDYDGWYLIDDTKMSIIKKIESTGIALEKKFEIRNGFATLKNKIYLFRPLKEDKNYYYFKYDDSTHKVEKNICRDAIKPNTLKFESEIEKKIEKLIFPYTFETQAKDIFGIEKRALKIISEQDLIKKFPLAYSYLASHKEILSKRDKGNRQYDEWFAYGRNQALAIRGYKLFLPYIADAPYFVFSDNQDLLFYNGYAIIANNKEDLLVLKKILMSKLFWYYIKNTSRPYSGDYYSVAKNYIKRFSICSLSEEEREWLINTEDSEEINIFLCLKYNVNYNHIK